MPRRPATSRRNGSGWGQLGWQLQVVVWLIAVASALAIYREAQGLVGHIFDVALLFIFAAITAVVLTPLVDLIQRIPPLRGHRGFAVFLLYSLFGAGIAGAWLLVAPTLIDQARRLPELITRLQGQLGSWGLHVNLDALTHSANGFNVTAQLGIIGGAIASIISVVLVIVISIYLLVEGRAVVATMRNLFPNRTEVFDFVAVAVGSTIESYVRGQIVLSALIGAYTSITMALLGVHYALVLGLLAAILELVPVLGATIAMITATSVALLQSPALGVAAGVIGILGHAMEAYVLGPRISGRVTQLHPLVAMSALLIGAEVGGVLGALFGVPIAAIANIVLGALYRSHQGDTPLTTKRGLGIQSETLPRLGDEIGGVDEEGIVSDPVPREKSAKRGSGIRSKD